MMLEKEEAVFLEVKEMAMAIIHLESSHTRIPAQTASDRETMQLLQNCSDVTIKLLMSKQQLSRLSDILPFIQVREQTTCYDSM